MPSPTTTAEPAVAPRLLRIQEVADEIGLTTRAVRYYEEQGLLTPARSQGAYRLYDETDVERLRFIKDLRDVAGFSLAEIRQLLMDEAARRAVRDRLRSSDDPEERRALLAESISITDRQITTLEAKAARIKAMIDEATKRRAHLEEHLAELTGAGGPPPHQAKR